MSHLSAERLAALADPGERPTAAESAHLSACDDCARERSAYEAVVAGARAERTAIGAPLSDWTSLAAALRAEGAIVPAAPAGADAAPAMARRPGVAPELIARRRQIGRRWGRVAAAVALLVGGALAGRLSAIAGPIALGAGPIARTPVTAIGGAAEDGESRMRVPEVAALASDGNRLVFQSVAEAEAALEQLEIAYQHAAAYLAEHDPSGRLGSPEEYRTRLAALERAGHTMREALAEAPYDPVITGYYLTTLGQREATLRQLNVSLPPSERLNSF